MNRGLNPNKLSLSCFIRDIKLKQIFPSVTYSIIEKSKNESEKMKCPICYSPMKKCYRTDACSHKFCKLCINKWFKINDKCPICRANFKYIISI